MAGIRDRDISEEKESISMIALEQEISEYESFLASKRVVSSPAGFYVDQDQLSPLLFDFQKDIVQWAVQRGRAAIFADCGLGKTPMQLEWAYRVWLHTGKPVLILAPLAVAEQTAREGEKFAVDVHVCRTQADVQGDINITNYEMLGHFDSSAFGGIVLDESSILKSFGGVIRKEITTFAKDIPYRLACTATPAPNDIIELTNHAEFLDIMSGKEIVALFFTQDGNSTHNWRLKGHAKKDFWRWLASWAVAVRKPSDLGYEDGAFMLPALHIHQEIVESGPAEGQLFAVEARTLQERRGARKVSLSQRVARCAARVNADDDSHLVMCNLNSESKALVKSIPGAVEITGSDKPEHKAKAMLDFAAGRIRVLVSKPSICGYGMNFQICHNVHFVGLSDSYEQFYQAVRRVWRFGQQNEVDAYIYTSELEGAVLKNIERKDQQATEMMSELVANMQGLQLDQAERNEMTYAEDVARGTDWTLYLGDCVDQIKRIADESIGLSVFSPPFPLMYAYTNSVHDMGNVGSIDEMLNHYRFLAGPQGLLRILMPGRLCCVHLSQAMAHKNREGYVGIHDFRGQFIQLMQDEGWIYAGEVTIDKDPQVKAARTKEMGLLFKTLGTDSSHMRMALADYLIYFRKPGENPKPIKAGVSKKYNPDGGWITEKEWIDWAHPVWTGIRETNVLNVAQARETDDERHLCPLQLDVIERAVKLWSAPGDTVFSPFTGIGSEGYMALKLNRQFVGIELKRSYWESAQKNLHRANKERAQGSLLGLIDEETEA
jgi:DNA modification methylase